MNAQAELALLRRRIDVLAAEADAGRREITALRAENARLRTAAACVPAYSPGVYAVATPPAAAPAPGFAPAAAPGVAYPAGYPAPPPGAAFISPKYAPGYASPPGGPSPTGVAVPFFAMPGAPTPGSRPTPPGSRPGSQPNSRPGSRPASPPTMPPSPRASSPSAAARAHLAAAPAPPRGFAPPPPPGGDAALWREVESGHRLLLRSVKARFPQLEDASLATLPVTMARRPPAPGDAAPGPAVATYLRVNVEQLVAARDARDPNWLEVTAGTRLTRGSIRALFPRLTDADVKSLPSALARKPQGAGKPAKDVATYLRADVVALDNEKCPDEPAVEPASPYSPRPTPSKRARGGGKSKMASGPADVLSLLAEAASTAA